MPTKPSSLLPHSSRHLSDLVATLRSELQRSERDRDSLRLQVQGLQLQVETQRASLSSARAAEDGLQLHVKQLGTEKAAALRQLAQVKLMPTQRRRGEAQDTGNLVHSCRPATRQHYWPRSWCGAPRKHACFARRWTS